MKELSINKDMKLSEHFTLGELCKTSYHTSDGNIPSRVAIENLRNICENWLEDLRYSQNTLYGDCDPSTSSGIAEIPIVITSGYRSEEVNMKCGGAKNSNHLTGCAVDIKCYGPEQMIRMAGILLDILMVRSAISMNSFSKSEALPTGFTSRCVPKTIVGRFFLTVGNQRYYRGTVLLWARWGRNHRAHYNTLKPRIPARLNVSN